MNPLRGCFYKGLLILAALLQTRAATVSDYKVGHRVRTKKPIVAVETDTEEIIPAKAEGKVTAVSEKSSSSPAYIQVEWYLYEGPRLMKISKDSKAFPNIAGMTFSNSSEYYNLNKRVVALEDIPRHTRYPIRAGTKGTVRGITGSTSNGAFLVKWDNKQAKTPYLAPLDKIRLIPSKPGTEMRNPMASPPESGEPQPVVEESEDAESLVPPAGPTPLPNTATAKDNPSQTESNTAVTSRPRGTGLWRRPSMLAQAETGQGDVEMQPMELVLPVPIHDGGTNESQTKSPRTMGEDSEPRGSGDKASSTNGDGEPGMFRKPGRNPGHIEMQDLSRTINSTQRSRSS